MKTILEARNINKIYEMNKLNSTHILKDISLSVEKGEFISIMGQSGSGKSTLLYNISGMDRPTDGSVLFNGTELSVMKEEKLAELRKHKMGFIFQQGNLLKNLNLFDNIILSSILSGKESKRAICKRARTLMKNTRISELEHHDITQVSGGQLQRAAICRSLMNKPEILFGDEPTGALNSSSTADVMDILTDVNLSGTAVILVTHDAKVAAYSERVLFMKDGQITAEKKLGKYVKSEQSIKNREQVLSKWLSQQGF